MILWIIYSSIGLTFLNREMLKDHVEMIRFEDCDYIEAAAQKSTYQNLKIGETHCYEVLDVDGKIKFSVKR